MNLASRFLIASAALTFAACSGDDPGDPVMPDAQADVPDAEVPVNCEATASYGAATLAGQVGFSDAADAPTQLSLLGAINGDAAPDVLDIELFKGYGAFTDGEIRTGTFEITGAETTFATCGVCVFILADYVDGVGPSSEYLAVGGTVTITAVTPNLTGTLANLVFEHVTVGDGASVPHPDGCASAITSLAFDAVLTVE